MEHYQERTKNRRLLGTLLLIAFIIGYAFVSMLTAVAFLPHLPKWAHLFYYLIAGILWAFPAMKILRWMMFPKQK